MAPEQRRVYDLFVLNIALQLFDAVATYQGLRVGVREGNPILVAAFATLGVVPGLLLFKAKACGFLFLLNRHHNSYVVAPTLSFLAGVYCVMSLVPWLAKFASVFVGSI
jgi:uncharacterized protein DUF5658